MCRWGRYHLWVYTAAGEPIQHALQMAAMVAGACFANGILEWNNLNSPNLVNLSHMLLINFGNMQMGAGASKSTHVQLTSHLTLHACMLKIMICS